MFAEEHEQFLLLPLATITVNAFIEFDF